MHFALNYSPEAATLLAEGAIACDLFKCPFWPDLLAAAAARHPAYVHFSFRTGKEEGESADWRAVRRALEETPTPHVNTHLAATGAPFDALPRDTRPDTVAAVAALYARHAAALAKQVGAERVVLENTVYVGEGAGYHPAGALPEVIETTVRETGCGLLLDLAHAALTAPNVGMDTKEYVERLPLDRLRELHISGLGYSEEMGRRTDHLPLTEPDWELVEWALEQIGAGRWPRPEIVALEYGGVGPIFEWRSEAAVLADQAPRVMALVDAAR